MVKLHSILCPTDFCEFSENAIRYASNIDLIVQGTYGRRGVKHMLLGSVAENIVRYATCPVLTVRNQ